MNLPISGARSVLVARLNRACKPGRSTPKDSKRGEEPTKRDLRSKQRAERSQEGEEDLEKLRSKELRARLVSLGLKVTGRKSELRARLQAALEGDDVSSEEESSDESEGEDDKQGAREYRRDVEDSLEKFSGDDLLSVNQWVEDFEEMAEVWDWSDPHMVAYAKKLLAGSAQAFVRQERCAKFWAKLKKALRNEFENVVSDQRCVRTHQVRIKLRQFGALIDTGSELTLMRADQHVKIGAPRLSREIVGFRGVGSGRNFTLGKFSTNIIIDNESYCITIHVVSDTVMQHSLIIGADFLDTVEISIKGGESFISIIKDENPDECPEVLKIDVETQASEIDLSHVKDMQHRLKRDLKRTKALLRDAQTMLEISKGDSTGKAALRQLKNQLEDAECARAVAVKAKQALEQELNETQASLQEVLRQRSEAVDRINVASRERTELLSQLEENKEELAEVLKKYRAAVQQVSEERRIVARHVVIGKVDHEMVSSSDSCGQQEDLANITRRKNLAKQQQQDVVDDISEFTEKDSVAGVRVVSSFRINSKRVNARRTKRQGKSQSHARNPSNNIDTKIRYTEDVDDEDDDGIVEDTMNVKTFEKEEIIVSVDGKLLTSSMYEPSLRKCHDAATTIKAPDKSEMGKQRTERKIEEERKRSSSIEDEQTAVFQEERDQLRADAKRRIEEIQIRNKRAYNRRRKKATAYRTGDLV
ncbi:myosin-2 heavy chain, non muscle-like, partial [Bombus bifarius]|uniref:Myosin-2 heavy chain, non muscle-like n=1 Tax=Bombus bifarius TaxID=103933 RepID=A0A6P8NIM5_9HYME